MTTKTTLADNVKNILELARLAPSVHNTQPWKVAVEDQTLRVTIDPEYMLADGDPTGRETIISMGIFCEAIVLSAQHLGFTPKTVKFHGKSVAVTFDAAKKTKTSDENVKLLRKRCTDRSIYTKYDITPAMVQSLKHVSTDKDVEIWVETSSENIQKTAQLTAQGISMALSAPEFRKELSEYLTEPWSHKQRGISVDSLYIPRYVAVLEPLLMRLGIGTGAEVKLEKKRWLSSSAVVYIATRGDMPEYWFKAGRDYLRVSLQIEKLGLSQATSAATVEASSFHEDIEEMLGTDFRLQSVLRVGQGSKHRVHSNRVDVATLLKV
jgi:hypothetical protein